MDVFLAGWLYHGALGGGGFVLGLGRLTAFLEWSLGEVDPPWRWKWGPQGCWGAARMWWCSWLMVLVELHLLELEGPLDLGPDELPSGTCWRQIFHRGLGRR